MDVPDARYARAGSVAVAYQVLGEGPPDLVFSPFLSNIFALWLNPASAGFFRRLAELARLIVINPRGMGLSDRPRGVALEDLMDDVSAVLDAAGSERATLFGAGVSANACALFAATYPERCERLILNAPYARAVRTEDHPWGETEEEWSEAIRDARDRWGDRDSLVDYALSINPQFADDDDLLDLVVWNYRLAASPATAVDFFRMQMETDITGVLGSIRVPTLVLYRAHRRDTARFVAGRIPGSQTVELSGRGSTPFTDDVVDAVATFLRGKAPPQVADSVLASVLFTDLVASTERAAELGNQRWRELLENHHAIVRRQLARYRGEEVDTVGDGFFCRFDGPARAIGCAREIVAETRALGLELRAGVHTGECELVDGKVAGIAVHTGARIASLADPGEVLVSSTVRDLVAGSGIEFEDRGTHELKGVPGEWRLFAVV